MIDHDLTMLQDKGSYILDENFKEDFVGFKVFDLVIRKQCGHVKLRPLQINFLFPVLYSTTFACRRAVHFHYSIIILNGLEAI